MIMKKVLNITEHKDGTYTLSHLTYEQMHAIQSALSQRAISLGNIQKEMKAEGLNLIPVVAYSLQFADDRLWVVNLDEYHKYHELTMGEQLNDRDIKEIAEEAHSSIESVRNEVSVSAAQQYIEYNEPNATYMNY